MGFVTVLRTEFLKLKRTKVLLVLAGAYSIAPFMMALMMAALKYPELGQKLGLLTTKAQLTIGGVDWPTYLKLIGFLYAGGIIVTGIAQAFLFGREYLEGTAKNMLTLPTHRALFVGAKLTVGALWFLAVAALITCIGVAMGFVVGLEGFSLSLLAESLKTMAVLALDVILLSAVPAWLAVATRGVFAPLGFSVLFLLIGDFCAHLSWGALVPWAIILLSAGAGGEGAPLPGSASQIVVAMTFAAGFLGSYLTLDRADNGQ